MKKLIPQLKSVLNEEVEVLFRGKSEIPYGQFTFERLKGRDISFTFQKEDVNYNLNITIPLVDSGTITWAFNKLSDNGSNWSLEKRGKLNQLNEIPSLVIALKRELERD